MSQVWVAKQQILCSFNQSLKDVLKYRLFQLVSDGWAVSSWMRNDFCGVPPGLG